MALSGMLNVVHSAFGDQIKQGGIALSSGHHALRHTGRRSVEILLNRSQQVRGSYGKSTYQGKGGFRMGGLSSLCVPGRSYIAANVSKRFSGCGYSTDSAARRLRVRSESENASTYGVENDSISYKGTGESSGEVSGRRGVGGEAESENIEKVSEAASPQDVRADHTSGVGIVSARSDTSRGELVFLPYTPRVQLSDLYHNFLV